MKLTPHEHLIKFESLDAYPPKVKPIVSRSKNGCRKRKKKCDEKKPICSTCSNKDLECIWPKNPRDKLPSDFQIPKKHKHSRFVSVVKFSQNKNVDSQLITKDEQNYLPTKRGKSGIIEPVDEAESASNNREESPDSNYCLDIENRPESRTGFQVDFFSHFTYDPEQKFLFACANGFIESVGPQYTHPSLTTSATFTPWIDKNPIMHKIASACGCSFLSWQNPDLIPLSLEKYQIAMNALGDYLLSDQSDCSSNWVGAALQLMCLCAKGTNNLPKSAVLNLSQSYKIIKSRFISSKSKSQIMNGVHKHISATKQVTGDFHNFYPEVFGTDNLTIDIRNSNLDKYGSHDFDTIFEKMFLESFVYNYSVAILLSESHKYLPNPFEVFNNLRKALKTPLFNCDVAWMNNPVFGASLDSFELVSKASYLIKKLHDPLMLFTAKKLYDLACFYTSPVIPSDIKVGSRKYKDLRDSVLMSEIVAKSAKLILKKLISMEIKVDDCELQKDLNSILEKFKLITPNSKVKAIGTFPAFIAGTVCINHIQKDMIVNVLKNIGEIMHGRNIHSVLEALQIAWGTSSDCDEIKTRGLDILFDKRIMSKVLL
ncbi:Nitrogen assimilation transcription factor nirA [Wickerhamomyces ciferrii]|uniref:Nitrogen assimilation transcription factor nirA n=1 Tax=Wickerhamomyces ciferrii (strain ATCC 14091 / BCRC 22168 / CBS 111 / JCM 3599 / NBRC 0793 / NRRL Y-1031 F-60-10) TaxID=1206466 RepID=K0KXV4_WICCF|nr:Nitrogen assimilation transcription factor nirA [Wickerhamomyces ciferrii]CCH45908.1 Nitrogen assimilation transcription factor nirA [Wickerhamomyces ciferrii]